MSFIPPSLVIRNFHHHQSFNRVDSDLHVQCAIPPEHSNVFFFDQSTANYIVTPVLLEVSFVIIVTRLLRFLLKPLRQPRIVSEILGGVIIGPSVLSHSRKFRENAFPDGTNFVVKNVGIIGFMYFMFLAGVKVDMSMVMQSAKKHVYIALSGLFLPTIAVTLVSLLIRNSMDKGYGDSSSIAVVGTSSIITAFPVLYPILKELNLLSSEVGRLALSIALVGDTVGIVSIVVFEAAVQFKTSAMDGLFCVLSMLALLAVIFLVVRPVMCWIIRNTPEGRPVAQGFIIAILLGVLLIGFLTDFLGMAIANGPLWLGLIIPDGPPLGTTLTERSETFIMEFFMPFAYAYIGMYVDVYAMAKAWSSLCPLFGAVVVGHVAKVVATLLASLFFGMPVADGLALGLTLTLRGQVDVLLFIHWMEKKVIQPPSYSMMVILSTVVSAISTPLISILYDPTKPYMVSRRCSLQHTPPSTELRVVIAMHDEEDVIRFINFLDASNPTANTPFVIFSLHLIELLGREYPLLIDHEKQERYSRHRVYETIHSAIKVYQESKSECLKYHAYTAMVPRRTMYQEICEIALINRATLILIPYDKDSQPTHPRNVHVKDVLANAPCSVGVLVDRGHFGSEPLPTASFSSPASDPQVHQIALLFLGGGDARDALAYADRMVGNPNVCLTVLRFLSVNGLGDNEAEKKLDDGSVTWFWMKNEANTRVSYREVEVRNGEETVATVRAINDHSFGLWIVGRKQGINPVLLEGLTTWSEDHELGVIGDFVASEDFDATASVLVIQQQILREQKQWLQLC